jgi:hypothetical protein
LIVIAVGRRWSLILHQKRTCSLWSISQPPGSYGRAIDKLDDGRLAVEFSAEAECELLSGDRYRVVRFCVPESPALPTGGIRNSGL